MSVFTDIDDLLNPTIPTSFRENMPPVQCLVWKGREVYDKLIFNEVFPFDTLDDVKRMICTRLKSEPYFHPKYTFVGVPIETGVYDIDVLPTMDTKYFPLDYLWFPPGVSSTSSTKILQTPRKQKVDPKLVTSEGAFPALSLSSRGRSTLEDIFLKHRDNKLPVFHVYSLHHILEAWKGARPIAEAEWNSRFAVYFPNISAAGPYEPTDEDNKFARTIHSLIKGRASSIDRLNSLLEEGTIVPEIKVTGIRMLRLILQKPPSSFEGCESLFYRIKTTDRRPFTRLIPSDGTAVTKVLVKGVLPIPALEDPQIIIQWAKEVSPTAGKDFFYAKYVHRPIIGAVPPIYGTIRVFDDGTADILLQPPKKIRVLDPNNDFRNFSKLIGDAMADMPQKTESFSLGEAALTFKIKTGIKDARYTRARLLKRLPFFQMFFQEIAPLAGQATLLSLRYKAVSQYASEDKMFSFLTQYTTKKMLEGDATISELIPAIQSEFQLAEPED